MDILETWSNIKKMRRDFAVGHNDVENHMKASCLENEILFLLLQFCRNCIWNIALASLQNNSKKKPLRELQRKR